MRQSFKRISMIMSLMFIMILTGCGSSSSTTTTTPTLYDFTSGVEQTISTIAPDFGTLEVMTVKNAVEKLDSTTLAKISNVVDVDTTAGTATLDYTLDSGETFSYSTNEILVLDEDTVGTTAYPLRKITGITQVGDVVTVQTVNATLTEIFDELEFNFTQEVTASDIDAVNFAPGVSLRRAPYMDEQTVSFNLDTNLYEGNGVKIDALGNVDLKLRYAYNLKIHEATLAYFRAAVTASQNTTVGFRGVGSWSDTKEKTLGNIVNTRQKFMVPTPLGPLPVWVDIKIPFNIGIEGTIAGTVETKLTREDKGTMGVIYTPDGGWSEVRIYDKTTTCTPPNLQAAVSVTAYAGPKLESKLYSLAGPWVTFYGALAFKGAAEAGTNNYPLGYEWETRGGVKSSAGADLGMLAKLLSGSVPDLSIDIVTPTTPGFSNWQIKEGPDLETLTLSADSIDVIHGNSYSLASQIDVTGNFLYPDVDEVIEYTDTKLTITAEAGKGTITGAGTDAASYTAPSSGTSDTITFKYTYKNQYDSAASATEITKTLTVNLKEPKTLESITASLETATVTAAQNYNLGAITVTAHYTDNTTADITASSTWTGDGVTGTTFNNSTDGTYTLYVSYTEGEVVRTDTITMTVTAASTGGDTGGTTSNPYGDASNPTALSNSSGLDITGSQGDVCYFKFTIETALSQGCIFGAGTQGDGSSGDMKVYYKKGAVPTTTVFDGMVDQADDGGGFQKVLSTGTYYMMLIADTDYNLMHVEAAWQ